MSNLHHLVPENRKANVDYGVDGFRIKSRHKVLVYSFLLVVALPVLITSVYVFGFAQDRYVSVSGFSVRAEDSIPQTDFLNGLTNLNSINQTDAALVRQFLESPDIIQRLLMTSNLGNSVSPKGYDPLFASSLATKNALLKRWRRLVSVTLDSRTGLIAVEVSAFSPEASQKLNRALIAEAAAMISRLSDQSRDEASALANAELESAESRLRIAEKKLTELRAANRIVDPSADLEAQFRVLESLQSQLSEAKIALGLLVQTSTASDGRLTTAKARVDVISSLIEGERQNFGQTADGYVRVASEFEARQVEVEYARESYLAARASLDAAIALAQRRSKFLAVHIQPSLPDSSEKPARFTTLAVIFAASLLVWLFGTFGLYGLRVRA